MWHTARKGVEQAELDPQVEEKVGHQGEGCNVAERGRGLWQAVRVAREQRRLLEHALGDDQRALQAEEDGA